MQALPGGTTRGARPCLLFCRFSRSHLHERNHEGVLELRVAAGDAAGTQAVHHEAQGAAASLLEGGQGPFVKICCPSQKRCRFAAAPPTGKLACGSPPHAHKPAKGRTRMLAFVWNCRGDASTLRPLVPYADANAASASAASICDRGRASSGQKAALHLERCVRRERYPACLYRHRHAVVEHGRHRLEERSHAAEALDLVRRRLAQKWFGQSAADGYRARSATLPSHIRENESKIAWTDKTRVRFSAGETQLTHRIRLQSGASRARVPLLLM